MRLAYRERRRWGDIQSGDINDYVKDATGPEFSAKDFRTWNASVLAAVALAVDSQKPAVPAASAPSGRPSRPWPRISAIPRRCAERLMLIHA